MRVLNRRPEPPVRSDFTDTRWSVVLTAGEADSPAAMLALETLCETYWFPIYVYVRRQGYRAHDAQDLTQEFFRRIINRNPFARVNPDKGKFRSYLLGAMNHFLADEKDKRRAQKRGAGQIFFSLEDAEDKYSNVPSCDVTPEQAFDRRWGAVLLEQSLKRLRKQMKAEGKEQLFLILKPYITGEPAPAEYQRVARELSLKDQSRVNILVMRLRRRLGELVRAELAQTVASKAALDEELRHLFFQ